MGGVPLAAYCSQRLMCDWMAPLSGGEGDSLVLLGASHALLLLPYAGSLMALLLLSLSGFCRESARTIALAFAGLAVLQAVEFASGAYSFDRFYHPDRCAPADRRGR